jgi:hypothetical protein
MSTRLNEFDYSLTQKEQNGSGNNKNLISKMLMYRKFV